MTTAGTSWFVLASALLLSLVDSGKVTRLALQAGNDIRTSDGQATFHVMSRLIDCICRNRVLTKSCVASFTDLNLTLNLNHVTSTSRQSNNCSGVLESNDTQRVTMTYISPSLECNLSPQTVYIQIKCLSNCLVLVRYNTIAQNSFWSRDLLRKQKTCNSNCCKLAFDPEFGKYSQTTSKMTTSRNPTTVSLQTTQHTELKTTLQTTYREIEKSTKSVSTFSNSTIPFSTWNSIPPAYNLTTDVTSAAAPEGSRSDAILLIAFIVTATLALAAIVISAVACRRHSARARSKGTELRGLSRAPTVEEPQRNVYSSLNPDYSGSIQKYAGISHFAGECGRPVQTKAQNFGDDSAQQEEDRMSAIYDNIADSDNEYLQPIRLKTL